MTWRRGELVVGYDGLRSVVADLLLGRPLLTLEVPTPRQSGDAWGKGGQPPDEDAESSRLEALVDLSRAGDVEAFGALYDHYSPRIYRFIYYRVTSQSLAEDLTSETFFRALRSIGRFEWQGKDFGAWLSTIARNLILDHHKAARTRLELTTDEVPDRSDRAIGQVGTEDEVLTQLTNEVLRTAIGKLPPDQHECVVMRFLEGKSISETAGALGRSEGAVKQLQLRAVRALARIVPETLR